MGLLRLLLCVVLLGGPVVAQGPTYGLGRTPTEAEIRAWDISISPTGEELPPGRGTPEEGERIYYRRGCATCHGVNGVGGSAPRLVKREAEPGSHPWNYGRILPIRAPYATVVWDYINRGMPLNEEGTLTADEVYALTAYLLYINDVIPEDSELDAENLPKSRCIRARARLEAGNAKASGISPLGGLGRDVLGLRRGPTARVPVLARGNR